MTVRIGLCHPDVRENRSVLAAVRLDAASQTAKAAMAEPERLLVSVEMIPAASFVGLTPEQARAVAKALLHQAMLIEQLISAKREASQKSTS